MGAFRLPRGDLEKKDIAIEWNMGNIKEDVTSRLDIN